MSCVISTNTFSFSIVDAQAYLNISRLMSDLSMYYVRIISADGP